MQNLSNIEILTLAKNDLVGYKCLPLDSRFENEEYIG